MQKAQGPHSGDVSGLGGWRQFCLEQRGLPCITSRSCCLHVSLAHGRLLSFFLALGSIIRIEVLHVAIYSSAIQTAHQDPLMSPQFQKNYFHMF